ncbi:hypothetical protein [Bacillus sp. 1P02SD]|uniref:hypothetical protein n=1 Tax=Bacillus sp. 1P02SD TaxID=3132264 RepID=UPI0039A07824
MRYLNAVSLLLFGLNVSHYFLFFNGIDLVPDKVFFPIVIVFSIIGLALAIFGQKGITRNIGVFGNTIFLLFTVVGPLIVRILLWNSP